MCVCVFVFFCFFSIMIISEAYWDIWDDNVCSSMQGEDVIEHTNAKCHLGAF